MMCIGWAAATGDSNSLIVFLLRLSFALYLLAWAVRSISQDLTDTHSESIIHISVLSFCAAALLGETAIIPSTPPPVVSASQPTDAPIVFWYSIIASYWAAFWISVNTPQGPTLHYPPEQIYSKKSVEAITNVYEDNVCGLTSVSSFFFPRSCLKNYCRCFPVEHVAFLVHHKGSHVREYRC